MTAPLVSADAVREYLALNPGGSSSQYTDATINSNLLAAQSFLETETNRWFVDRPGATFVTTTMLRVAVAIPGFRNITQVIWGGSELTVAIPPSLDGSVWPIADSHQTGVYTALQFRAFRADNDAPWWLADSKWFDKALDSPYYPGNYGGGYAYTSMPNDLYVLGDGGYDRTLVPYAFLQALKVLGAWYTMRPASILADTAMTPAGGVLTYTDLPPEVGQFVRGWKSGQQMVSAG